METPLLRTSDEGEHYVYLDLWYVVEQQLEHADYQLRGSFYCYLIAMVFAFHALEAYLNYLGDGLAPHIGIKERKFFSKPPYRGFDGKVRKVLKLLGISEPNRECRPYRSVWELKKLRDTIAHPQRERISYSIDHPGSAPPEYRSIFENLVDREKAIQATDDVREFIKKLHAAAEPGMKHDEYFKEDPFDGISRIISGNTIPI